MNTIIKVLERFSKNINQKRFNKCAIEIRKTEALSIEFQQDIVIVSQIYHSALDMSLLALKSFGKVLGRGRFELLDDGSLTQEDYAVLKHHLPGVIITKITDVDVGKCPRGGTWERLVHIINLTKQAYVIQVDTDTLTIGAVPEVDKYIRENQAFTIGGPMWPESVALEYMSSVAKSWHGCHVQVKTEEYLHSVESIPLKKYLRGCSAFTGFPKGAFDFKLLEAFSVELENEVGKDKWHEWGSEQISSSIMISLCDNAQILPWPKYMNYGFPETGLNSTTDYVGKISLIHFIGSNRYEKRHYERFAKAFIGRC
jgi:hypothetical protein